jgi:hypothetical protein
MAVPTYGAESEVRAIDYWFQVPRLRSRIGRRFSMSFFRSSLFVVRAGDRDVGVGPSVFLQIFLTAADRAVDRKRAAARSDVVADVMKGIDCPA